MGVIRSGNWLDQARVRRIAALCLIVTVLAIAGLFATAHGTLDFVVPVEHGRALDRLVGTGSPYLEQEEASHESLPRDGEVVSTVSALLTERVRDAR